MSFHTIEIKSWNKLSKYIKSKWIYRGHRCANWHLQTSLERCCIREGINGDNRIKFETEVIREFKRVYHQYSIHYPGDNSILEWLSLMQHHGSPTRLLDFTYSIYVAAYFALENAISKCAIWAINGRWALNESFKLFEAAGKSTAPILWKKIANDKDEEETKELLLNDPTVLSATPLNPFRLNERLRVQLGLFLVPGKVDRSFLDNLTALPGHDKKENIIKIVMDSSLRKQALQNLYDMNLSRTSLYPGLDGFAQTLNVYHPIYKFEKWNSP